MPCGGVVRYRADRGVENEDRAEFVSTRDEPYISKWPDHKAKHDRARARLRGFGNGGVAEPDDRPRSECTERDHGPTHVHKSNLRQNRVLGWTRSSFLVRVAAHPNDSLQFQNQSGRADRASWQLLVRAETWETRHVQRSGLRSRRLWRTLDLQPVGDVHLAKLSGRKIVAP